MNPAEHRLVVYRNDGSRDTILDITLTEQEWDAIRFEIHATLAGMTAPEDFDLDTIAEAQ